MKKLFILIFVFILSTITLSAREFLVLEAHEINREIKHVFMEEGIDYYVYINYLLELDNNTVITVALWRRYNPYEDAEFLYNNFAISSGDILDISNSDQLPYGHQRYFRNFVLKVVDTPFIVYGWSNYQP